MNGVGVMTCILGLIALVLTDTLTKNKQSGGKLKWLHMTIEQG